MRNVAVLAGNAHVRKEAPNQFRVDHQPFALEAALQFVRHLRHRIGHIGIAMDHQGSFTKQFLHEEYLDKTSPNKLNSKQRKQITLKHLHKNILEIFRPLLGKYGVEPGDIRIFPEEMDRSSLRSYAANPRDPRIFLAASDPRRCACDDSVGCQTSSDREMTERQMPNCNGLTAEIIRRIASQKGVQFIRTFWQKTEKTVRPAIISRGTELAYSVFRSSENVRVALLQTILHPYRLPGDLRSRIVSTQCLFVPGAGPVSVLPQPHIYCDQDQIAEEAFPRKLAVPEWDRFMKETEKHP